MNHIKIVCKWPMDEPHDDPRHPRIHRIPDLTDCWIYFVDGDRREHPISDISGFTIRCDQRGTVTATFDVCGVEVDIDAMVAQSSANIPSKL